MTTLPELATLKVSRPPDSVQTYLIEELLKEWGRNTNVFRSASERGVARLEAHLELVSEERGYSFTRADMSHELKNIIPYGMTDDMLKGM